MTPRRWLGLVLFALLTPLLPAQTPLRYEGHQVVRAFPEDASDLETLLRLSPDVWSESIGVGPLDLRIPPGSRPGLLASGIPHLVLIPDVQARIDAAAAAPAGPGWFDDYRTHDEVNAYLDSLQALRPDLATVFTVGASLEGREIRGIRISSSPEPKPALLLQGCQHAREWIAVMVPVYIADRLVRDYDVDPAIQARLDSTEIIVVPIVNPDGYVYSHDADRLWRKNRRNNGNGTFGVDLNRNWSFGWGGAGSSGDPGDQTYRGVAPFSEPESTAMRDLALSLPLLRGMLDIHSYSQLILQPWGYTFDLPPDHDEYEAIGEELSGLIFDVHQFVYEHGPASTVLYLADGVTQDWAVGELDALGLTFELRDTGQNGFLLPPDQILPNGEEIFPAILRLAEVIAVSLEFQFPEGLPTVVDPGVEAPLSWIVDAKNGVSLDPQSVRLFARVGPTGAFEERPVVDQGGSLFAGTLPAAPCASSLQFYFEAETTTGEVVISPPDAPIDLHQSDVYETSLVFEDDFELDLGWSVSGDATDGQWDRGVPVGGGDRGDPPVDSDGSGQCFLTDNVDGNSDVDGGSTVLTSPVFDASQGATTVSYRRWYSNTAGANPGQDIFEVEVSNDGGASWTLVETVGPGGAEANGGWYTGSFLVADVVTPTPQTRVRFRASDLDPGSVVEAGLDAFRVVSASCDGSGVQFVRGDANDDGAVNIADVVLALEFIFGAAPVGCENALDLNDDETIDIGDPIYGLSALFDFGPLPPPPHPACGEDPTEGGLSCEQTNACP